VEDLQPVRNIIALLLFVLDAGKRKVDFCKKRQQEMEAKFPLQFQHVRVKSTGFVAVAVDIQV